MDHRFSDSPCCRQDAGATERAKSPTKKNRPLAGAALLHTSVGAALHHPKRPQRLVREANQRTALVAGTAGIRNCVGAIRRVSATWQGHGVG